MSLKNLFSAIKTPSDLYATYQFFRKLGNGWADAVKNAVNCVVLHHFVIF